MKVVFLHGKAYFVKLIRIKKNYINKKIIVCNSLINLKVEINKYYNES